jgi:hypothetical protein
MGVYRYNNRFLYASNGYNNGINVGPLFTTEWGPNVWYFFAITHDTSGNFNLYINNNLVITKNNMPFYQNPTLNSNVRIGSGLNSQYDRAYLDDFRYYNKVITTQELGWIYTNQFPQFPYYFDANSYFKVECSGLPFINRGFGKAPLALCRMSQTDNNVIGNNEIIFNKPNETADIKLDLTDINTNNIGAIMLSDTAFVFEVDGV